jgi:hypothetical protein
MTTKGQQPRQRQKQIPCGNDNQKSKNSNNKNKTAARTGAGGCGVFGLLGLVWFDGCGEFGWGAMPDSRELPKGFDADLF